MTQKRSRQAREGGATGGTGKSSCSHYLTKRPPGQPLRASTGQVAGYVDGATFTSVRAAEKHMLRKPPAWALDASVLRQLRDLGVERVVIITTDWHITYHAPLDAFFAHGFHIERGYGRQVGLKLGYWSAQIEGADDFSRACEQAHQLALWSDY